MPLFSTRAASSFGFADLYSHDPDLQLERCSESSVSVYYFQLCFVLFFRCSTVFKSLIFIECNLFIYTLYIFVYDGIVVNNNEMFFCLRSNLSCCQNDQGIRMVLAGLTIDSDRAKFLVVTFYC